jgi:hypothetical protein
MVTNQKMLVALFLSFFSITMVVTIIISFWKEFFLTQRSQPYCYSECWEIRLEDKIGTIGLTCEIIMFVVGREELLKMFELESKWN